MPPARGCLPCREARRKCDGQRPTCERCAGRGVACFGYPEEHSLIFRDQTEKARHDSERARSAAQQKTEVLHVRGTGDDRLFSHKALPWLRDVSNPRILQAVLRTVEDRAVEMLFNDYVVYPGAPADGPGYLSSLPVEFEVSAKSSALHKAAEAFAYANLRDIQLSSGDFRSMALERYDETLGALREEIGHYGSICNATLLAVMIIDMFEMLYLSRDEPLGPHHHLVMHQIENTGIDRLTSNRVFHIFRIAHHRLQDRQLIMRKPPLLMQREMIDGMNLSHPEIRVAADNLKVIELCHAGAQLLNDLRDRPELHDLFKTSTLLLQEMHAWVEALPQSWQPFTIDAPLGGWRSPIQLPNRLRVYQDAWIAYQRGFQTLGRIVLRSMLVEVLEALQRKLRLNYCQSLMLDTTRLELSQDADLVVQSLPALFGLVDDNTKQIITTSSTYRFRKVNQLFAIAVCWELRRNGHFSDEQRGFADAALSEFRRMNSLVTAEYY